MSSPTPLDDVDFLARSAHRVEVLRTLASGDRTRRDLHDETGISQPTLGRVLGDFEDRNWVERKGPEYALTPLGELVVEEFEELLETVGMVQRLGDVLRRLPIEEMPFDVREFADATVWEPEPGNTFDHIRRMETVWYEADRARMLGSTLGPMSPEERRELMSGKDRTDRRVETIVSPGMFEKGLAVTEETGMVEHAREMLESGRANGYLYDGPIPLILVIADETAMIAPTDENGVPTVVVVTENEAVRSWVETTLDEYREQSVELTADDLPPSDSLDD